MMVEKAAGGREKRREKKRKARVPDQTKGHDGTGFQPLSICLSDPQRRDEAVAQVGAQNNVKKGVHFGTPSIEGKHAREPEALTIHSPVAHPSVTLAYPGL